MSALREARLEGAYQEALGRAGGDIERLARGLMSACLELAGEHEALRQLVMGGKRKRAKAGRPKSTHNPLPLPTKEHGRRAFDRFLKPHRRHGMTASEAALFELIDAGILASSVGFDDFEKLRQNVAKRVSEAESDSR